MSTANARHRRTLMMGSPPLAPADVPPPPAPPSLDPSKSDAVLVAIQKTPLSLPGERLLKACQTAGLRLSVHPGGHPEGWEFTQPYVLLGRGSQCHVQLTEPHIARRHAYVQVLDSRVFVCDLGTRSGVMWQDRPLTAGWIPAGDEFHVGPFSVQCAPRFDASPQIDDEDDAAESHAPLPWQLEFLNSKGKSNHWVPTSDVNLVGRMPFCRMRLAHESVDLVHCSLIRTANELWVIDLASQFGTFVNGRRVACAALRDGSELKIGGFELRVRQMATEPTAASVAVKANIPRQTTTAPALVAPMEKPIQTAGEVRRPVESLVEEPTANHEPTPVAAPDANPLQNMLTQLTTPMSQSNNLSLNQSGVSEQFVLQLVGAMAQAQQQTFNQFQSALSQMLGVMQEMQGARAPAPPPVGRPHVHRPQQLPSLPVPPPVGQPRLESGALAPLPPTPSEIDQAAGIDREVSIREKLEVIRTQIEGEQPGLVKNLARVMTLGIYKG